MHHTSSRHPAKAIVVDAPRVPQSPPTLLVDINQIVEMLNISKSTILRMIKDGSFPKGRLLGRNMRRWQRTEVEAWIATRFGPDATDD